MTPKIWLDYFPPGQTERGIWSKSYTAPSPTAFDMSGTPIGSHQAGLPSSGAQQAPAVEAEPVAWRVYSMMRQGAPNNVKARGIGSDPTEYLYPAHREADARECARLMRGGVQPLYAHPATPPAPDDLDAVESLRGEVERLEQVLVWANDILIDMALSDVLSIATYEDKITAYDQIRDGIRSVASAIRALITPEGASALEAEKEAARREADFRRKALAAIAQEKQG